MSVRYGSDSNKGWRGLILRSLFLVFLLAALVLETYYIFLLRARVSARSDELRSISMQLETLKSERSELHQELSSIKYAAREDADENPSVR